MTTTANIPKGVQPIPPNHDRPIVSMQRSVLLGIATFLVLAGLMFALIYERYQNKKQDKKEEALSVASNGRTRLQESLAYSLSAAKTLSFFIDANGQVNNFDSIASDIIHTTDDVDALQLVPGGVIRYMYPLKGNEKVIGYDILKDPARSAEALKAIEKKQMFFAGPFELRQGGIGVVGRLPVFRNNKFWGFSAVVIKMSTLLRASGIDSSGKSGYYYQLSKADPVTGEEQFFLPNRQRFSRAQNVSVNVPNGEWKLSVVPVEPFEGFENILMLGILGFMFSALGAGVVFSISRQPKKLDELVKIRTRQLKESEENYKVLFDRSPLPLWIYDRETYAFLDVNDAAINLYGYSREEFLQMNVMAIRPGQEIPKFLSENENISDDLRDAGVWTHVKKNGEQIQVLIFARNIFYKGREGRLILLMDVTEKIRTENELVQSEEKYRLLIEQASDAIILYSFDGTIHGFNKAAYLQTGYEKEEFEKLNFKELFFEGDSGADNPSQVNLHADQTATLYRQLKRMDGSVLLVELNTRLLPDGKILAIVRDITERKKNEEILVYQARLLDSVSDAITSLDVDRRIVSWNRACEELYGFSKEEVLGKRIPEIVENEFPGTNNEAVFKQVYTTGEWKGEFNFIHPKTAVKTYLLGSVNLLKSKEGAVSGFIITGRDITDRIKAQDEINKSHERFELISQATNEAVWDHDLVNDETWGNKKLHSLYGFEPGVHHINYETFLNHIHPEERAGVSERMKTALANSATSIIEEFRFRTVSGEYRHFYDRAYVKYDEQGKPLRILGAMQDITEREAIKKQILKEKELSDLIINTLPGIFYLYNQEGKFLRWNRNFETVTGFSGEEISNMHPLDFFQEKDHALLSAKIANVFVTGEDYVEADFMVRSGKLIPYYFTGKATEYEGQVCLMGVGLDFSERQKAAAIIRESEEKYRTLFEQASDGIFIADKAGNFIIVNPSGLRMSQYSMEELKERTIYDLVLPEELKKYPFRFSEMEGSRVVRSERRMKRKDGKLVEVEITAKFISGGRFLAFVRDVSDRKKADKALRESEERYRTLVENAPEALVVYDVEKQKFVSVSESATRLFKMTEWELLKVGLLKVSPEFQPDGRSSSEEMMGFINKAIEGEKPAFEWTHLDSNGNEIPCEIWLVRLPSENKILVRGSIVDITERKKAAEEIRANSELLRELYSYSQNIREEERTHIAREIHDELGQQLTGLKMDISWINRKLQSQDHEINEKLLATISLIDTTIQTVRKIATELRPSILDDLGLIAALEWQGEEFEKRSGIRVNFNSNLQDVSVQPNINTALFRIYQELLTNVARHSGASVVNTSLYIHEHKLYLSVEDNGTGFVTDQVAGKKTLGLRGINERTNLIGGVYEIKSKPGEGTFVLISVPL